MTTYPQMDGFLCRIWYVGDRNLPTLEQRSSFPTWQLIDLIIGLRIMPCDLEEGPPIFCQHGALLGGLIPHTEDTKHLRPISGTCLSRELSQQTKVPPISLIPHPSHKQKE